jgi:predicted N-formylglutamate amidohydrolase
MTVPSDSEAYRLIGQPRSGGVLVVADHASNRMPADLDLGIAPDLLSQHIAIDIGVAAVAERMVRPGTAAYLANVSRLVCDFNRDPDAAAIVPETSDGHVIAGNALSPAARADRIARFFTPYHSTLAEVLDETPQALILSLHSFTPRLTSDPEQQRPWQVGVLYNEDDRAARLAIPLLQAEGLCVGDQQPYSGKILNATMNRHAEAQGRPYLGIEVRQDEIAEPEGQARWAERLARIADQVVVQLS